MESLRNFLCNYSFVGITMGVVIIFLLLMLVLLSRALMKKERAFQLIKFSVGTTGVKFEYELNRDVKMKLLVDEIVLLKSENTALREEKGTLRFILATIAFFIAIAYVIDRVVSSFRSKND
jgi:hypothetical protein